MTFRDHSIKQITDDIRSKKVSPIEIAQLCIDQEDKYQAWECFDGDILMSQAKACQQRLDDGGEVRPLEAIPIGIKDIINTEEFPTQMGSPIWKGFTPGNDARVVDSLRRNGAVIPGKTVTAEFAVHTLGKTLNPHDVKRNPGTSSSGSAVAVSTGMVPAAIGTQTAGSIVRPASYCGVYGCKPSFGLIPRTGMLKTNDSLDTVGFFVSHARDIRIMFEAMRVHGRDYPISDVALYKSAEQANEIKVWRIGIIRRPMSIWDAAEEYAKYNFINFMLSVFDYVSHETQTCPLPNIIKFAHSIHSTIYDKSLSHYFQEEYKNAELVSPVMNGIIERGQRITYEQYQQAWSQQEQMIRDMDGFFDDYDILISLSTAGIAPLRDEQEKPDPALIWTMCHLPVVSVPAFAHDGMPFGIQVVARKYNDYVLFAFIDYLVSIGMIPEVCR